jgi:hypothetical protein
MGHLLRSARRLILFDGRGASGTAVNFFDGFGFDHTFQQPGPLRAFLAQHLEGSFRVLYQPWIPPSTFSLRPRTIRTISALQQHFAAVTQMVIGCGRLIYAIDEVDRFTGAGWMPAGLDYLVNQGRHVQVSMICTSRRPAQVPRELTSQSHLFYVFRMTEPADLDYLREYIGKTGADVLPQLKPYNCLRWEETTGIQVLDAKGR